MRLLILVVVNSLSTLMNIGKRPFLESSKSQKATRKPMLSLAAVAATPMRSLEEALLLNQLEEGCNDMREL